MKKKRELVRSRSVTEAGGLGHQEETEKVDVRATQCLVLFVYRDGEMHLSLIVCSLITDGKPLWYLTFSITTIVRRGCRGCLTRDGVSRKPLHETLFSSRDLCCFYQLVEFPAREKARGSEGNQIRLCRSVKNAEYFEDEFMLY